MLCVAACTQPKQTQMHTLPTAPKAEKIPHQTVTHGDTLSDNYFWLRERENPKVISYLTAENAYTKAALAHTEVLQATLFEEMKARIKQDDATPPQLSNGYYYYTRYEKGKEYPIYCRKKNMTTAPEEITLDVNEVAKDKSFCAVTDLNVSPNNQYMAFGVDTQGRNIFTVYVKDLSNGTMLTDEFKSSWGGSVWANDSKTLFYDTKNEATLRSEKVYKHLLGTQTKTDQLLYHEKDEAYYVSVGKSKDEKYVFIDMGSTLSSEILYLDANTPQEKFKIFAKRAPNTRYSVEHHGNSFLVLTNEKAQNYRLMQCPENATEKQNWQQVIAHKTDVLLEGLEVFEGYWVLSERKNGLPQLHIYNLDAKTDHYLNFGEADYDASGYFTPEYQSQSLRYYYSSLTTPNSVYDYDMKTKQRSLIKEQEVLGGFDKKNYQTERIYATATDGTSIPISIVYKKTTPKNGTAPVLLYGYGSYGASMESSFRSSIVSLMDRGFVYAIAHIRGGKEMGESWYENGKLLHKKNTFTDFIACGDYLVSQKIADKNKIFAMGGSAGGLLMGAVANLKPELWRGIIAAVPFVDVMNTMLDASIPLTTNEYDEWGNPNQKTYYDYMKSYSPYDNVTAKKYPNMLITTGLHDSQVQYWEPAKWTAKLRELKTDDNLLLLHTNMEAGHGGKSGRFERLKEIAMEYAFMFHLLDITQ